MSDEIKDILIDLLPGIDDDSIEYFHSMISNGEKLDLDNLKETMAPFIESFGLVPDLEGAEIVCEKLYARLKTQGINENNTDFGETPQLLDKVVTFSKSNLSEAEQAALDTLWGFDKIREKRNETMEMTEAGSAKYERKAAKDQKKWLEELEAKFIGDEEDDDNQISNMTLPDLSGNNREKDIHVNNFTITFGGQILLEDADLRIVYGRRYGLIGRNGIGKTTLLKHMANFDIEGFPRHHRVLHVKQEVKSSELTVLEVVLAADVERTNLLQKEKELLAKQQTITDDATQMQQNMTELSQVYDRMEQIGVSSAESRAAAILSGLQFSDAMQRASTDSLSGGWRMRVALAGALLIEPDLLMLDEPTNHLDLEAVLWLQSYLQSYRHSILLVSHDRAFLNEVCTDVILFKNLKLTYYRGNYDSFESTRKEALLVQQRQHEAQMVKLTHMQEFVDKFRFNAKRASLVQSRIKAIEREEITDAVEEEKSFSFSFFDAGQLGRPIIQIESVTFGYGENGASHPLFRNVHMGIDQSSRIALVGPNGAGKSTLLGLIQDKLKPSEGYIRINGQLRLGVFTQHHLDSFDLTVSALQNMLRRWPKASEADLRAHIGRYEITGNDTLKPMKFMSGGQKSRVAFACLTYGKPHVVILDEPTNHLDLEAIQALANALIEFSGGVLVISHDQHFIKQVCSEIWVVGNESVLKFDGDFDDYKKIALAKKDTKNKR